MRKFLIFLIIILPLFIAGIMILWKEDPGKGPAQTVQELENQTDRIQGNSVTVARGSTRVAKIQNVVELAVQGCYYYTLLGDATMSQDDPYNPTVVWITPNTAGWTKVVLRSVRDIGPGKPEGCP